MTSADPRCYTGPGVYVVRVGPFVKVGMSQCVAMRLASYKSVNVKVRPLVTLACDVQDVKQLEWLALKAARESGAEQLKNEWFTASYRQARLILRSIVSVIGVRYDILTRKSVTASIPLPDGYLTNKGLLPVLVGLSEAEVADLQNMADEELRDLDAQIRFILQRYLQQRGDS